MRAGKRRANMVLTCAAGMFAAALTLKFYYPGSWLASIFLTVTEASLAGGVADWFAVTAFFRKPLGFSYHTALVPRNRKRIIDALSAAVERDFLSKQAIKGRLSQANLLEKIMTYAQRNDVRAGVRSAIDKLLAEVAETLDPSAAARYGERVLKLALRRQSVVPHLAAIIGWALAEGKGSDVYKAIMDELAEVVRRDKTRDTIYDYLKDLKQNTARKNWLSAVVTGFLESIDGINLKDAAIVLQKELIDIIDELMEEEHPVRLWFQSELKHILEKLTTDEWEEAVNDWKNGQLTRMNLAVPLTVLAESVLAALKQPSGYRLALADWLTEQTLHCWQQFQTNGSLQLQAEEYLKTLLFTISEQEHYLVGLMARRALQKLSDEDLNAFIEDKAGDDLDWVRINGVVVGGVAGLGLALIKLFIQ
ncbi:DUF445 family protein [Sporomusa aerivorans]|uniref:DUF445 family protein n=1 Tax=Sporomusa aerivorans TaxID=204936 RepID=UPI00352A0E05